MKILICNDNPMAHMYERLSWARALKFANYEVDFWQLQQKSTYDAFDESKPDIAFLQGYNLTPGMIECIKERPNLKLVIRVSDWSDWNDSLDRTKYPVLHAEDQEKKHLEEIQKLPNPLILHTHHHVSWLMQTHEGWQNAGFTMMSLMNCADIFGYCNGVASEALKSDICFIGGYWGYKAQKLDKWLLPLCSPESTYNIKIFGNQAWPTVKYCGMIPEEMTRHVLKSAAICPNVSEPHSTDFGYDIISRPFNLLANKCFCISDNVQGLKLLFPNQIVYTDTPQSFNDAIFAYKNEPQLKEFYIANGYKEVMKKHTAFDRMVQVFGAFQVDPTPLLEAKIRFIEQLEKQ